MLFNKHPGNQRYRSLVKEERPAFLAAKLRKDKRAIAMSIMQQVNKLDPPGRFLVEEASQADCSGADNLAAAASSSSNKSNTVDPQVLQKVWVPASNDKIVRKILHRLRELKGLKVEEPQETTSQNEFDMQATDDIVSTYYNLANAATDPDTNLADDTMLDFLNDPLVDNHDNNSTEQYPN